MIAKLFPTASGKPATEISWHWQFEFKPQDLWIGAFWKRIEVKEKPMSGERLTAGELAALRKANRDKSRMFGERSGSPLSCQEVEQFAEECERLRAAIEKLLRAKNYSHGNNCPESCFRCQAYRDAEEVLK